MPTDSHVAQAGILVPSELPDRIVHQRAVENAQAHQPLKMFRRQPGDPVGQLRFQLCDHVLQSLLTVISQVHEHRHPRGEFDQLFLNLLPQALSLLLSLGQYLPFFCIQLAAIGDGTWRP